MHTKTNLSFLRNEFSKIFEELFTITLFTAMTQINDQTKNKKRKQMSIPSDSVRVDI